VGVQRIHVDLNFSSIYICQYGLGDNGKDVGEGVMQVNN
jgi:hypothetical protein